MVFEVEIWGIRFSVRQIAIGAAIITLVGSACLAWLIVHAFSGRRDR